MEQEMHEQITVRQNGDISIFELSGQFVGGDETDALRDLFFRHSRQPGCNMIVNVADVPYVSSSFIGALLSAHASIARRGGTFAIAGANDVVAGVLSITKLDAIIPVHATVDSAIASFK